MGKRFFLLVGVIFLVFLFVAVIMNRANYERKTLDPEVPIKSASNVSFERITVIGNPSEIGMFDPDIEYNKNGSIGYMVYSALLHSDYIQLGIDSTYLAKTTDNGKTWTYVKPVNLGTKGEISFQGKKITGVWKYEVPSLIYDENNVGKEWKLFTHKIFYPREYKKNFFLFSWISYKYASDPEGEWSEEIALFRTSNTPPPPYRDDVIYNIDDLSHELDDNVAVYTEPGSIVYANKLYLTLTSAKKHGVEKTILLVSEDGAKSWEYVATLLDTDDAKTFGYDHFDASSLAEEEDRIFLTASPGDKRGKVTYGGGIYIIEFEDLTTGKLKRDPNGKLIVIKAIPRQNLPGNAGGGQATYHKHNLHGGIIVPKGNTNLMPTVLQLYNTNERLTD